MNKLAILVSCLFVLACGDDATTTDGRRPVDGTWKVQSLTCDGAAQQLGDFTLVVEGGTGRFVQVFGDACQLTIEEAYAYPTDGSFEITPTAISCAPSDGCPPPLAACQLPPSTAFDFEVKGDNLIFRKTAEGPGDAPCMPGQAMEFEMVPAAG